MAVAQNALFVANGLGYRLAQGNADILHRVVVIDVQVALGLDLQIHHPVTRDLVQHVLQKRHAGIKFGLPGAIQVHRYGDLGLQRISRLLWPCAQPWGSPVVLDNGDHAPEKPAIIRESALNSLALLAAVRITLMRLFDSAQATHAEA